jgi:hypothetical protein
MDPTVRADRTVILIKIMKQYTMQEVWESYLIIIATLKHSLVEVR